MNEIGFGDSCPAARNILKDEADTSRFSCDPCAQCDPMKYATVLATTAVLALLALVGAVVVVYSGVYNVGSTQQHQQWVYTMLETTMRHSVQLRARHIEPPPLTGADRIERGAQLYHSRCVQCHGAPGVSQADIGKSMQPVPGPLVDALQKWKPREIYWITRHGIRMSGMPAWEFRLPDAQLWDVVAFVNALPGLTPQTYSALAAKGIPAVSERPGEPSAPEGLGDVQRGRQALYQYACNACHIIPGVTGSRVHVGPPLQGFASRSLIAGKLANTPDNLVHWLQHPKEVKPLTAMPDLGVGEVHARDMAAYLATLR